MAAKVFACLVFIFAILSNQVFHIEGRNLVVRENASNAGARGENIKNPNKEMGSHRFRFDEGYMDSYRPTTPGHSPGIGHSKHD
ncbi:hypothetical protein ABFS83_08G048000 [Erythranthe nasuta]